MTATNFYTMKKLILLLIGITVSQFQYAQTPLPTATLELQLVGTGGTTNRSGIAYNPNQQLYYSVNAGSSGYNIQTFDAVGNLVSTVTQGFDYRGCWWNPNTNTLEGNGYSSTGIWIQNLDASYYPISGSGTVDIPSTSGPNAQSCADYDFDDDQIIYHNSGTIYIHTRATNALVTSFPITGLPVATSNLNYTSVAYTGIPGMELGVYDYINKSFYFISKADGSYQYTCQLPGTAPGQNYLKMGFENEYVWIFDGSLTWNGYKVLNQCSATASTLTETVCSSYLSPAGNTYTSSGVYYDTIPNAAGCDSVIMIDLAVQNSSSAFAVTSCDSYMSPAGNTYTSSGTYYDTISNMYDCDSIITIDLTIVPNTIDNSVSQDGNQLMANQLVAAYQWMECDSVSYNPISGAVNQIYNVMTSGYYAVEITMGDCSIMSECVFVDLTGIDEIEMPFTMYPNPANNVLYFDHNLNSLNIEIFSSNGQLVFSSEDVIKEINTSQLHPGAYIVHVQVENDVFRRLLIIE